MIGGDFVIIRNDNSYVQNEMFPNSNFLGADNVTVIDDNSELADKFIRLFPYGKIVTDDNGNVVDVIDNTPDPAPVPDPAPTDHERLEALENIFSEMGALSLLGGIKMSKFYTFQVKLGKISIDDVPLRWREQVRKELEEDR